MVYGRMVDELGTAWANTATDKPVDPSGIFVYPTANSFTLADAFPLSRM